MKDLIQKIDRNLYPEYQNNWDDELFRERILECLRTDFKVLDLGAGAGVVPQMNFKGLAREVCGVDPDARVRQNPHLDEGMVGLGEAIPYPNEYFDVAFADNVFEHLTTPEDVLKEISRVLKPGGLLLAKTPNKNHYMPLIARLTPYRFHQLVNRLRGRAEVDTFPTFYRINRPKDIERYAEIAGFGVRRIEMIEGRPEYLRFCVLTYLIGAAYERCVNGIEALGRFRIVMLCVLQKNGAST